METSIEFYIPSVGDVFFVQGEAWLSKAIRFFMNKYRKFRKLGEIDFIPNHCAVVINLWGNLKVAEANRKGIEARYSVAEYFERKKVVVKRHELPVPDAFSQKAASYFEIPHRYDIMNFIHHIILTYTGHWIGPIGERANRKLYCSEYVALMLDWAYGMFYSRPYKQNPLNVYLIPELQTVFKNF